MPDTKFSLPALKEHLRKNILVYIVAITVMSLLTNLLWLTTRPRIPTDREVLVYLADTYSNPEPLNARAPEILAAMQAEGSDILAMEFQSLLYTDPETDYTGSMLLLTRLATGEGDAFFASEKAMEALVRSGALRPLDEAEAQHWLDAYGLEPYYAQVTDEETGETTRFLAGLRLDAADGLMALQAFNNRGAFLALPAASENPDSTARALELFFDGIREVDDAQSDGTE